MHISQVVGKAHTRASDTHKCFLSKNRNILLKAYVTYVRQPLEYAVCVSSMILLKLNRVQANFAHSISRQLLQLPTFSMRQKLNCSYRLLVESCKIPYYW